MRQQILRLSALLLFIAACEQNVGSLRIVLLRSSAPGDEPLGRRAESLRISAHGPEGTLLSPQLFSTSEGSAKIPALRAGEGRIIAIDGLEPEGTVVSRARSGPLSITAGQQTVELFIGRINRFSRTPANAEGKGATLDVARAFHSATLLPDGRVLLAGGTTSIWRPEQGTEPEPSNTIELLDGNSLVARERPCREARTCMISARIGHTASMLPTGNVLIVGGTGTDAREAGASETEIFSTKGDQGDQFFEGSDLTPRRRYHAAAPLGEGIAIVSGQVVQSQQQPALSSLTTQSSLYRSGSTNAGFGDLPQLKPARRNFALLRLLDGQLLASGGFDDGGAPTGRLDTIRPAPTSWEALGARLAVPRAYHTATLMGDGSVLFIGGLTGNGQATATIERFEPGATIEQVGELTIGRWAHTTTVMRDGTILVVGGFAISKNGSPSQTCEFLRFVNQRVQNVQTECLLQVPRAGHSATLLQSGWVLVAGGMTEATEGSTGGKKPKTRSDLTNTAEVLVY